MTWADWVVAVPFVVIFVGLMVATFLSLRSHKP